MKKSFIFGLIAAALGFTGCSSEDDAILTENTQKKGMVLNATVEQPAETRATINDADASAWAFHFATGDKVEVTNSAITNTYYTFTKGSDTKFASEDAQATSSEATWYAYFPSKSIWLIGQSGKLSGETSELTSEDRSVANLYALAGATSVATTGETGLTIAMQPKVAIIKINNQKGAIDIRVKYNNLFVTGLMAKNGEAAFQVLTCPTAFSFLKLETTGTYYIVVPADVPLKILDGKNVLKSGKVLDPGKYYELTIDADPVPTPDPVPDTTDPNLLPGLFSVSANKTVQFTKGNLYWDGTNREFKFEGSQTAYPRSTWNASHIGHFFWTKDQAAASADSYSYATNTTTDVPFFAESNKSNLTVEGTTGYYALSQAEWEYLIGTRPNAATLCKTGVTVGATKCFVIAPDNFTGTLVSTYTADEINTLGLLCLPVAGQYNYSKAPYSGMGYYWTSTPNGSNNAWVLKFDDASASSLVILSCNRGDERYCLRLVK